MSRWLQLIGHAEEQAKQSAQALTVLRQKIAAVQSQREQMEMYRQDYAQRAATPGTVGKIRQLNTIRHFGDQVQVTVRELDMQLEALRERYEKSRETWHGHYQRERALKALQTIEERKQTVADERVNRRAEDDFSLQVKRRRDAER